MHSKGIWWTITRRPLLYSNESAYYWIPITFDTYLLYVNQQSILWSAAWVATGSTTWKSIRYTACYYKSASMKDQVWFYNQPGQLSWRFSRFVGKAEATAIKQLAAIAAVIGDFIVTTWREGDNGTTQPCSSTFISFKRHTIYDSPFQRMQQKRQL